MVKTNPFVKVRCTGSLALTSLLLNKRIPTLYMGETDTFEMKCYAMSIALTCKKDLEAIQSSIHVYTYGVVMLTQDLGLLGSDISVLQSMCERGGVEVSKWI
jgi:hypothetical protein